MSETAFKGKGGSCSTGRYRGSVRTGRLGGNGLLYISEDQWIPRTRVSSRGGFEDQGPGSLPRPSLIRERGRMSGAVGGSLPMVVAEPAMPCSVLLRRGCRASGSMEELAGTSPVVLRSVVRKDRGVEMTG